MAEALASAAGHNLTRPTFLEYCAKHSEIERELAEVAETRRSLNRRRKDLRKNMVAAGIDIEMFDLHLVEIELTPEERQAKARKLAQMVEWRTLPPGFQASMDYGDDHPVERALSFLELQKVEDDGFAAGRAGRRADSNPHKPGSEGFVRWHSAWLRGQSVSVREMGGTPPASGGAPAGAAPNGHANGSASAGEPSARRGRPRGSRNRKTIEAVQGAAAERAAADHGAEAADVRSEGSQVNHDDADGDPGTAPPPGE